MKLKMFFIISGFNPFLVLKMFVASICKFLKWIVTDLFIYFGSSSKDVIRFLYTTHKALSWILFIRLFNLLLWNIHTNGQYPNWKKTKAFIVTLHWLKFIKCTTFDNAFNFCETRQRILTRSSMESLVVVCIPNSF